MKNLKNKESTSCLWNHHHEEHNTEEPSYTMNVTEIFYNDPMLRQISEAVKIKRENNTLNNKQEYRNYVLDITNTHS